MYGCAPMCTATAAYATTDTFAFFAIIMFVLILLYIPRLAITNHILSFYFIIQ